MTLPADHPEIAAPRIGVLLVNLGTPDAPDAPSVRRYLAEFLSDRRVVEIPQILWQPILRGIILTTRPKKSAHAYAQVWTDDGSPLAAITRAQTGALQRAFGDNVQVAYAMRYGNPAIGPAIDALKAAGCERILIAPLYPQYCAATTATVVDAVNGHLAGLRWQPSLRFLPPYPADPAYLDALKMSLETGLAANRQLLERFEAIGGEAGGDDGDVAAFAAQPRERRVGCRLQPFGAAEEIGACLCASVDRRWIAARRDHAGADRRAPGGVPG